MKKWKSKLILALLLGLAVYAAMTFFGQANDVGSAFLKFDLTVIPLVLSLSLFNFAMRFLRWQYYLRVMGISLSIKESLLINNSAFALAITPGKIGDLLKSFYLKKTKNIAYAQSAPIIFVERITDLLGMIILAGLGMLGMGISGGSGGSGDSGMYLGIIGAVCLGVALVLSMPKVALPLIRKIEKIPKIGKFAKAAEEAYLVCGNLLKPQRLLFASLAAALAWFFECVGLYYVFGGLGVSLSLSSAVFIYAFASLIGAISMLPGGLGGQEATMTGYFILLNISSGIAVAATMLIRFMTLWFAVAVGVIFWLMLAKSKLVQFDKLDQLVQLEKT